MLNRLQYSIRVAVVIAGAVFFISACSTPNSTGSTTSDATSISIDPSDSSANEETIEADDTRDQEESHTETDSHGDSDQEESHTDPESHGEGDINDLVEMAAAHVIPEAAAAIVNPIPYNDESVTAGAQLFSQSCAVCHGPGGAGDGPGATALEKKPADLTADHVQATSDGGLFIRLARAVQAQQWLDGRRVSVRCSAGNW